MSIKQCAHIHTVLTLGKEGKLPVGGPWLFRAFNVFSREDSTIFMI